MRGVEGKPHVAFQQFGERSTQGYNSREASANLPMHLRQLTEQGHPEVIELVSVLYNMYSLQRNLQHAASSQLFQRPTQPNYDLERYGAVLNIQPSFNERCRRMGLFVEAGVHILRGGFVEYPEEPEYLRATVNAAFAPYGYEVVDGSVAEAVTDRVDYNFLINQQIDRYDAHSRKTFLPSGYLKFYPVNGDDGMWEAFGRWKNEPEVIAFAQEVSQVKAMRLRIPNTGMIMRDFRKEEDKVDIPGLHPWYKERYDLVKGILENLEHAMAEGEGYDFWFNWLGGLVGGFNEGLFDLDMRLEVNPHWQPEISTTQHQSGKVFKIEEIKEESES